MSDEILQWENLSVAEKMAIKMACENSFEAFLRIFFQLLQGQKFLKNWHHTYECKLAEDVYFGKIKRGIINVAPGSTKTEIWSIHWIAWCILKCITDLKVSSRWLPLSYSDELVKENASRVKEILDSEEFQWCWPVTCSKIKKAKDDWEYHDQNGNRHRLFGCSINGQVTGRRAGFMIKNKFTGALILDDPMPPKDASSAKLMDAGNKRLNRVVRSRLAYDDIPIVMVQQRIAKGDTTDYLMSDKTPDKYQIFKVPALINREYFDTLPLDMQEACVHDTGFKDEPISYWPDKEPTETLKAMQDADNLMFSAQYQQAPDDALQEGVVYKKELDLLIAENRFCHIPIEPALPVHTFWDLGINDTMVVWLMQAFGNELRMIACYGNNNESMEHYINWLLAFKDKYKIRFGEHYAPHDISVRDLMTGKSRLLTAQGMGIKFKMVPRPDLKVTGINALKKIFNRIFIDKNRCDTDLSSNTGDLAKQTGWKALKGLRRQWDHDHEVFKDETGPKWCTNYTDALQQMALHYAPPKQDKHSTGNVGRHNTAGGWMSG